MNLPRTSRSGMVIDGARFKVSDEKRMAPNLLKSNGLKRPRTRREIAIDDLIQRGVDRFGWDDHGYQFSRKMPREIADPGTRTQDLLDAFGPYPAPEEQTISASDPGPGRVVRPPVPPYFPPFSEKPLRGTTGEWVPTLDSYFLDPRDSTITNEPVLPRGEPFESPDMWPDGGDGLPDIFQSGSPSFQGVVLYPKVLS